MFTEAPTFETDLKGSIERILKAHDLLDRFKNCKSFSVRLKVPSFMPLSIERHGSQVTVAHYYEQNGDLVPDPDMEFRIDEKGTWLPIAIQHAIGIYESAIDGETGKVRPRIQQRLEEFATIWGHNLIDQGFERAEIDRQETD